MTKTHPSLLARLLRLDARYRAIGQADQLCDHMRRDIGLEPTAPPPRNPFAPGW